MGVRLNVLPPDHTREDFDFEYKDHSMGPIRVRGYESFGVVQPTVVWCIRHGWENEIEEITDKALEG